MTGFSPAHPAVQGRHAQVAAVPAAPQAVDTDNRSEVKDCVMLKWLTNRFLPTTDADGAVSAIEAIGPLIARLDSGPPESAVKTIANHLASMSRQVLATPSGCSAFGRLDEYAQRPVIGPVADLWDSLLADSRGQHVSETAWGTLTHYYRTVHAGYRRCLDIYSAFEATSERDHADAMIIACRAMMALARSMLLLRTRYLSPPPEIWSQIGDLIDWVERRGNATAEILPYPATELNTTLERELLTALLIEVAPTGNFRPGQIYALDRLLRICDCYYRFSDSYDELARPFAYAPSSNAPPQRWPKGRKERPGFRFFGLGGAYVELCNARDQANAARKLPEWLGSIHCSCDDYLELLDQLVEQWSLQSPRRRQRRDPCAGEIVVAHEWDDIRRLVRFSEFARSGKTLSRNGADILQTHSAAHSRASETRQASRSEQPVSPQDALRNLASFRQSLDHDATESWLLNDSSKAGLGATTESPCAWVKVGMLVTFRNPDSADWQVAMVRRLNCDANGRLTVGMIRISGSMRVARLRLGAGGANGGTSGADPIVEYDALMLGEDVSTILVPIGVFDHTWKYTLRWDDRTSIVKMERSLERGLNFERVEIATVEAAHAA
jgi:hypothetical protein